MAQYRAKGPDGKMYKFSGPSGLSEKDASFFLQQHLAFGEDEQEKPIAPVTPPEPKGEKIGRAHV